MNAAVEIRLFLSACAAAVCCCACAGSGSPYGFDGGIDRCVLENYLSRAVTLSEFLTVDSLCNDGDYPCKERDVEFIRNTGAKFIGRAIYRWGDERVLNASVFWSHARDLIAEVHRTDPDVIFQAAVFEAVTRQVDDVPVPAWVFEALGFPVEERNFRYADMLDPAGRYVDQWGRGASVPDIRQVETRLWFLFLIGSYVDIGVEAIHLGQVLKIGMNDPEWHVWGSFLQTVRCYVNRHARRHWVLFDAHTPTGGMLLNGVSLLDFNSFPSRPRAVEGKPMECVLERGWLDAFYGRSMACRTPSGWRCDALPYLVELDNFGISDTPGMPGPGHYVWGYDEITWFYLQPADYRSRWLRYADAWIRENDPVGHLQMPGARVVRRDRSGPVISVRAIPASDECPYGMGLEQTIREIWDAHPVSR